eukprot:gene30929-41163_t
MKNSELLRKLRQGGFRFLRQGKGSHEIWWNPDTKKEIVITNHGAKEVGKGLAEKILKDAEKTNTGYSAYAKSLPIYTVGGSMEELKANMVDALATYANSTATIDNIKIVMDMPQFFEFYKEINAKAIGKRIGMNQTLLSQYVNGIKKPSEKQTKKILEGIRSLGKELTSLDFA